MNPTSNNKMTSTERRAVFSLSSILSLRMIGLFMVLPIFSLYAKQLSGSTPTLIGFALGIYGLSQALFQIPFGSLSDRFGRKPIIILGLAIFALGSVIAGLAQTMTLMIIGRALQGMGAVGSTIMALMADLTREDQRSKAMAIAGMSIGFSFSLAMLLGPLLSKWMPINNLFFLAAGLGLLGIGLLTYSVPTPINASWHRDAEPEFKSFIKLLTSPELAKLNLGIFILHIIFTASFVVLPISLQHYAGLAASQQWHIYLPALLTAFVFSLVCIGMAERKRQVKPYFLGGIAALILSEIILCLSSSYLAQPSTLIAAGICLFFAGFSLLEAFLPSLISRTAPAARKGSALGIYSCSQFLGIFVGGVLGGWLYGKFGFSSVYLFCIAIALFWFALACLMQPPRYLVTQMWRIAPSQSNSWDSLAANLHAIPGMIEVTFIAEDGIAYLKMESSTTTHPDFIRLKEHTLGIIS
jgi:MFS family permease